LDAPESDGRGFFLGREAEAAARVVDAETAGVEAAEEGADGGRGWGWERDCSPMEEEEKGRFFDLGWDWGLGAFVVFRSCNLIRWGCPQHSAVE
jgi:hypothetical protein